ncbi:MAG: nucleotidyl transferase AbiEii/AbiGii toxin family protein [Oscillospiraceae bacterium]|nr:nucleotidyl transferase AbiEii/AbiGii toxin family protein [Oscillospiraceae bacterium]
MAEYNKQILSKQAQEAGFIRDTFEKMLRLAKILKFISEDTLLSKAVVLKGGTAINLTIFNLPRLSIDIDLDYAYNNSKDDMMKDREPITAVIRRYMATEGYELSDKSKSYHSLDSFVYTFTNSAGIRDNIKIEINYSLRCHVLPFISKPIEAMEIFNKTNVLSVAPIEIFASKIVALLTRTAARDLYDVNNMITYGLFDESEAAMLRKCVMFYFTIASDEVPEIFDIKRIYSLTNYRIRTDLQPVLRKKDRFDLLAAQNRVEKYLTELLVLSENERQYFDAFRANEYKSELLFENVDILARIRNHPMALWKINKN